MMVLPHLGPAEVDLTIVLEHHLYAHDTFTQGYLEDTEFMRSLRKGCAERHLLVAMRKDQEGHAGILTKTRGTWLPRWIRKPLSKARDRLVALRSQDMIEGVLQACIGVKQLPRIHRDVSVSCSFEEFLDAVQKAAVIVTDRMHVGILGHMLGKRVFLRPGRYHKIRGVYEMSMSGSDSRTRLIEG